MTPLDTTPECPTQPNTTRPPPIPAAQRPRDTPNGTRPPIPMAQPHYTTQTTCSPPIPTAQRHQTHPTQTHATQITMARRIGHDTPTTSTTNPHGTATQNSHYTRQPRSTPIPTAQRIGYDTQPINPHSTATQISTQTTPIHANPKGTAHRAPRERSASVNVRERSRSKSRNEQKRKEGIKYKRFFLSKMNVLFFPPSNNTIQYNIIYIGNTWFLSFSVESIRLNETKGSDKISYCNPSDFNPSRIAKLLRFRCKPRFWTRDRYRWVISTPTESDSGRPLKERSRVG